MCDTEVFVLQEKHGGAETRCPLMVKILDAVKGTLVRSVTLRLSQKTADGGWTQIANGYETKGQVCYLNKACRQIALLLPAE